MAAGGIGKQCRRYGKREEGRRRGCSHRGYIAESARQAAMPNRLRWMEIASEVPPFQREVGCDHHLMPRFAAQNGAVVADAQPDASVPVVGETATNLLNQVQFFHCP